MKRRTSTSRKRRAQRDFKRNAHDRANDPRRQRDQQRFDRGLGSQED